MQLTVSKKKQFNCTLKNCKKKKSSSNCIKKKAVNCKTATCIIPVYIYKNIHIFRRISDPKKNFDAASRHGTSFMSIFILYKINFIENKSHSILLIDYNDSVHTIDNDSKLDITNYNCRFLFFHNFVSWVEFLYGKPLFLTAYTFTPNLEVRLELGRSICYVNVDVTRNRFARRRDSSK